MIKTRADLFEAAAKMMRMCDKAGIPYACKVGGYRNEYAGGLNFRDEPSIYEFPLAIVENRPVFVGDELYSINSGEKLVIQKPFIDPCFTPAWCAMVSWNPPKPKTLLVELQYDDVKHFSLCICGGDTSERLVVACRKALDSYKN